MNTQRHKLRVVALTLIVGALPFLVCASAQTSEPTPAYTQQTAKKDTLSAKEKWLDDYSKPVGLTYGAQVSLNTTYLWRGLCVGALNIQPSANIGYGGAYIDLWGNIGATDWALRKFQPEVDITLGFNRWGLDVHVLYIHNFNTGFFDFKNHVGDEGGNGLEVALRYTVSSKLPLSFFWGTRVSARDGYINDAGDTVRAYSSYAELSYTHRFRYGLSLYGAVGITPWKSFYTSYERNFAVQNVEVRLIYDWSLRKHLGLRLMSALSINPSGLAANGESASWHLRDTKLFNQQCINTNVSLCLYLK